MKWSKCFLKTKREISEDCLSYELLVKAGLLEKLSAGIFSYHSILLKSIRKLENIIREELEEVGYEEILMAMVQKKSLWEESGRWDSMGDNLLKLKNRNKQDFCLAGTHEEAVVDFVRNQITSYKDLDVKLFQIQTKFRDELRTKFGLIRAKEFIMKDAYSFALNNEDALSHYNEMVEAYKRIFDRLGIEYIVVEADSGDIGGKKTHEFHLLNKIGDDTLCICSDCNFKGNKEIIKDGKCSNCQSKNLTWSKGIELGHCFLLGEEYSKKMKLKVQNDKGKMTHLKMGCYGIGVSRIIQAIFEKSHDKYGLIWNKNLSAYKIHMINIGEKEEVKSYAQDIYQEFKNHGIEVFWDNRKESTGVKMNDMDKLGFTYQLVISEKLMENNQYELRLREDKNQKWILNKEELIKKIN